MSADSLQTAARRADRRIAFAVPAADPNEQAAKAMKLLDSVLWVFKGTTQSNWLTTSAEAAQVIAVHHEESAARIARWRDEGKLIVTLSTDAATSPAAPYTLVYPFPPVSVLGVLEQLDAELDARVVKMDAGHAVASDDSFANGSSNCTDEWGFIEALRTLRSVNNDAMWLAPTDSKAPLWIRADVGRYCCGQATANALKTGPLRASESSLHKSSPPPEELSSRPGAELLWFQGYHASAALAPWLNERALYRLTRWPDFGLLRPDDPSLRAAQLRVLAALDTAPATPAQLSVRSCTSQEVSNRTLNALAACKLIEVAPKPSNRIANSVPAPAARAGGLKQLLRELRKHLGL